MRKFLLPCLFIMIGALTVKAQTIVDPHEPNLITGVETECYPRDPIVNPGRIVIALAYYQDKPFDTFLLLWKQAEDSNIIPNQAFRISVYDRTESFSPYYLYKINYNNDLNRVKLIFTFNRRDVFGLLDDTVKLRIKVRIIPGLRARGDINSYFC